MNAYFAQGGPFTRISSIVEEGINTDNAFQQTQSSDKIRLDSPPPPTQENWIFF